ncbi:VCBS repeat-containing protein [Pseudomonas schmalbachii]|uniref:VCBS repeat-containing protein n=1 Tax=Pseudomonas schmalbachii TaxID=2816993 RepID=A0ABS3TQ86_9PSED|nr:VCBS repeat-containing protein [Pseudomonas schmalbachii]MBO3274739.1 VCBS repeat-containing protein [Pseudomonas schmalbachii]
MTDQSLSREAALVTGFAEDQPALPVPPASPVIDRILDDTGPAAYQGVVHYNGYTDDTQPTLSGSSAEPGHQIRIYNNDRLIGTATVKGNGTWLFTPTNELLEGQQSFRISAFDPASGLESTLSEPFVFHIDLTPPSALASILSLSEATEDKPLVTADRTPLLFGTLNEALAAHEKLQISLDGGASWADVAAVSGVNWQYQDLRELHNGSYTYLMRTVDAAGNLGEIAQQQITIASEPPRPDIRVNITGITPDTGVEGDFITSASKIVLLGTLSRELPQGGKLQLSIDGGKTWKPVPNLGTEWFYSDPAVHALGTSVRYEMRVVSADGQEIPGSYTAQDVIFGDLLPPGLHTSIELVTDTAVAIVGEYSNARHATNKDFVTRDDSITLSGKLSSALQIGQHLQVTLDGGKTWETIMSNGGALWSYTSAQLAGSQALDVELRLADGHGNSISLGKRDVIVDLDSPVPFAFAPDIAPIATSGERAYYSSARYGLAEAGATVALVQDVNRDGRYQEGLDRILGHAVAGNDGRWSFDAALKDGVQQLGFVTWDVAGNTSDFGPQVVTTAGRPLNETGTSSHETNWGGTVTSVRGVNSAAMAMSADGSWSFFQSNGYAQSSTCYMNSGTVFSGQDRDNYRASYLAEPVKVTNGGNGHMVSKATFADYNRDGLMDVLGNVSGNSAYLPLWTARADGTYSADWVNNPNSLNIGGVIAWDGNGDGYTDFIVLDNTIGKYAFNLIVNNGGVLKGEKRGDTRWASEVSGVDLDNNGTVDLAGHSNQYCNTALGVLLTNSDGSWRGERTFDKVFRSDTSSTLEYSNLANAMTWADFNGDGYLDLFLARGTRGSTGYTGNSDDSRIYLNKGNDAGGNWLGIDNSNPLFFNDVIGLQKSGLPFHFDGGSSFAVDWNHDGRMDVVEVPRHNASWSGINASMPPMLFLNRGNGDWLNSGKAMSSQAYDNVSGAVAVDYDFDGAVDLVMYRTSNQDHLGSRTDTAPSVLIRNENLVAEGSSLILRILDKHGLNSYYGNTVQLFDSAGQLVATQIINPQSGVTNDSSGLVYFYGLDAGEVYSARLLTGKGLLLTDQELGVANPTWAGLTTGAADHAYVLTAGKPTVNFDSQGIGAVGSGYNDSFTASEGNDVINGGGGWNILGNGDKVWSATQGMDEVDYRWAGQGVQVNLQTGVSVGMGNDTLKNIEGLKGGAFADTFSDNAANNHFEGRGGDDVFYLFGGGNDTLIYRPSSFKDITATAGNGHDEVYGFAVGDVRHNGNADIIDLRGMLGYDGPIGLNNNDGVLQLNASSRGLLDYLSTRVEGNSTVLSIDRDGMGGQLGFTDLVTLVGARTDLLNLLQNHQVLV